MAALHNYTVSFVSLRAGTFYTVTVGGSNGSTIALKGGAEPFVTQEDASEDMFTPIRTQSGYLRIVDDGFAADGVTSFDWRDLIPATSTDRPVTLTHQEGGQTVVDWQGYLQTENYSGVIYGGVQEREFAVQCVLSSLAGTPIDTTVVEKKNFAYLISTLVQGSGIISIESFSFQGGSDAALWLSNQVDYQNFMHEVEGSIVPRYNGFEVLTDICKFWGWTCRTHGRMVVFACMDDSAEDEWVTFTPEHMESLRGEITGTSTVVLSGDIFANMQNEETVIRGIKSATVKADVNPVSTILKFAPKDLEDEMGEPSVWVQSPDEGVGYFKSIGTSSALNGRTMHAFTGAGGTDVGGFERRLIYSSGDSDNSTSVDAILIKRGIVYIDGQPVYIIGIDSKRAIAYGGGSLSFGGTIYKGAKVIETQESTPSSLYVRLGIGLSRETAKWFYGRIEAGDADVKPINTGWDTNPSNRFRISVEGGQIRGLEIPNMNSGGVLIYMFKFKSIPVADDLYGYIYLDIYGADFIEAPYEIGNFEITYSRKQTILPSTTGVTRARVITPELQKVGTYVANNANTVEDKWNADCIFASDNNMEYGYGLILSPSGGFVKTVQYGGSSSNQQHPEQHLANRVARFGARSRRMLKTELRSNATGVGSVTARTKVSFSGTHYPIAIDHNWRDDVTILTMIEL